jgi:YCII-related domain
VRVEGGTTLTTDGPFAGMKEAVGGLFVLEADNLDAAIEVAARVPAARHSCSSSRLPTNRRVARTQAAMGEQLYDSPGARDPSSFAGAVYGAPSSPARRSDEQAYPGGNVEPSMVDDAG